MTDPTPIFRSDLLASGITADELRQALRSGALAPVAPGAYLRRADADGLDDVARHRVRARCVQHALGGDAVLSHVTAALFHGADLWEPPPVAHSRHPRPEVRRSPHRPPPRPHGTARARRDLRRRRGGGHRARAHDRRPRPVADRRRGGDRRGFAAADPSVRAHGIPGALDAAAQRCGVASARRVVALLDGRSESPGESLGRLRLRSAGIPEPNLQRELFTPDGTFVARVDFFREELGVVGEFDGMGKYGAGDPASTAESVRREKLREDAIHDLGFEVVRWTWPELFRFDVVADRFARAVERARHPHPPTAKTPARRTPRAAIHPVRG
ncbi:hypothetical protein [Rhodococcus zopfii]|uniref:hypothetical protein n=1 Tax=Rhodococcus zopfii TaxID=43772 RepID=UPI00093276C5